MLDNIGDSIDRIAELPSPMVRTCHVGNNTSNIWGMLPMIPNSCLLEYDHTSYSLDENCIPWVLIGRQGKIKRCFDHYGREIAEWKGIHVNKHLRGMTRKSNILNYGIYANLDGEDLMTFHFRESVAMSKRINNSLPHTDSMAILEDRALMRELVNYFCETGCLNLMFNRWITISRKGFTSIHPITKISYPNAKVEIQIHAYGVVFRGKPDDLTNVLLGDLDLVAKRFRSGERAQVKGYPWFTLIFGYLFTAVREAMRNPKQQVFWHGGGSSSQYYTNDPDFQKKFNLLWDHLSKGGFLPPEGYIKLVPTFNCQLFATTDEGERILSQILDYWDGILDAHEEELRKLCYALSVSSDPARVASEAVSLLNESNIEEIKELISLFNKKDSNKLPVAHIASSQREYYNKFGAPVEDLKNKSIKWPTRLRSYRWGEIELLLKTMGEIYADIPEEDIP